MIFRRGMRHIERLAMSTEHIRRPDPQRSRPIRTTAHHLRMGSGGPAQGPRQAGGAAPAGNAPTSNAPTSNAPGLDAMISDAVGLGYRVIDEQIRQGRAAAERLRAGIIATEAPTSNVSAVIERAANLSMELTATWLELLSAFGSSLQQAQQFRPAQGGTRWPPAAPITEHEVECSRPNVVDVHFNPDSGHFVPRVLDLHFTDPKPANDPMPAPLTGVHFRLSPDKRRAVLHISVPDKQPPGTYSGPIVDAATGHPGGMLVVRLLP